MREIRTSGSEGGGVETNRLSLPLSTRFPGTSACGTNGERALAVWAFLRYASGMEPTLSQRRSSGSRPSGQTPVEHRVTHAVRGLAYSGRTKPPVRALAKRSQCGRLPDFSRTNPVRPIRQSEPTATDPAERSHPQDGKRGLPDFGKTKPTPETSRLERQVSLTPCPWRAAEPTPNSIKRHPRQRAGACERRSGP
jgi:hypothetical protein